MFLFERSCSTWTKIQTQCNLWKRKKMPISYKLSEASRLNSLFCLCLIPKLSKSMAQPDCCCRLTRAERNGIVASGCLWRPPSLHEIILIALIWYPSPLPTLHMFLLKDLFTQLFKQACSLTMRNKLNSDCKQANEARAMRDAQKKRGLWNQVKVLSWELREIIRVVLENYICLFETLEFRGRLHAQSAQVNSMPEILDLLDFVLGLRQLRICGKLQEVEGIA